MGARVQNQFQLHHLILIFILIDGKFQNCLAVNVFNKC